MSEISALTRLYIPVRARPGDGDLLEPGNTTGTWSTMSGSPVLCQGDEEKLQLVLIDNIAGDIRSLPSGWTIIFSAKQWLNNTQQTTLLLSATGFSAFNDGDDSGYEADLSINVAAIDALFTALTSGDELVVRCEVLMQNAGATVRMRRHFFATLARKTYANEGVPTDGEPAYPAPDAIITTTQIQIPAGLRVVFSADGTFRMESVS